jgi:hypothetical protein
MEERKGNEEIVGYQRGYIRILPTRLRCRCLSVWTDYVEIRGLRPLIGLVSPGTEP